MEPNTNIPHTKRRPGEVPDKAFFCPGLGAVGVCIARGGIGLYDLGPQGSSFHSEFHAKGSGVPTLA